MQCFLVTEHCSFRLPETRSQLGKSDYKTALFWSHKALCLEKFSNDLSAFHSCDKMNQTKGKEETGNKSTQVLGTHFQLHFSQFNQ